MRVYECLFILYITGLRSFGAPSNQENYSTIDIEKKISEYIEKLRPCTFYRNGKCFSSQNKTPLNP